MRHLGRGLWFPGVLQQLWIDVSVRCPHAERNTDSASKPGGLQLRERWRKRSDMGRQGPCARSTVRASATSGAGAPAAAFDISHGVNRKKGATLGLTALWLWWLRLRLWFLLRYLLSLFRRAGAVPPPPCSRFVFCFYRLCVFPLFFVCLVAVAPVFAWWFRTATNDAPKSAHTWNAAAFLTDIRSGTCGVLTHVIALFM